MVWAEKERSLQEKFDRIGENEYSRSVEPWQV